MEITNRTADLAAMPFPQPGLDSPSAIPKPLGDITAGLQSFADLAADMATTDEIGWEQPVRLHPADNITAGVPALSTLLEEDEEGRTSTYGDENAPVSMELTADTGGQTARTAKDLQPQVQPSPQQSTGSVMMDLTDGNTRDTALARGVTADFTLGGYTRAIEHGKHPAWGAQQTAQLDNVTTDSPNAASNPAQAAANATDFTLGGYTRAIEQGSHPVWGSQRTAQLEDPTSERPSAAGSGTPGSVRRSRRISLMGQSPSVAKRAQPEGQRSKWGFVPGEDDTLDLNLEKAGQLVMGDATYNHIYNGTDSTGSVTQRLAPGVAPQAEEEEQNLAAPQAQDLLSPGPAADDHLDALHNAIVSNTDGSAAAIAAGTPTGDLTMHSPRRASMAGSVRDVTAHLLDDAQPDPMSQAEPIVAQQVVQAMVELPAPAAGLLARPLGRDVTTGLLLEAEPSPEVQGPLGALRRQLNQLHAPQADMGGYGRSDSTGPHTLKLLQATGSTTQLLAPPAKPRGHRVSGATGALLSYGTTQLLADRTMASAVGNASRRAIAAGDQSMTMDLEDSGDGNDLLADNTMDGLDCPPELPQTGPAPAALPQVAETPRQAVIQPAVTPYSQPHSVFPGGALLARTPPTGAKAKSRIPASHTNRQLDMEAPLSPQPEPTPTPVLHNPSPNLLAMPRSHMRTADKQRASSIGLLSNRQVADGQMGDRGQGERQPVEQASPSAWGVQAAGPSIGGLKLARTPNGDEPIGGARLARTPIGTPRQASPSPSRLNPDPMPASTARERLPSAAGEAARNDIMGGRQLARTPAGAASARKLPLFASQNEPPVGTPGGGKGARTPTGKPPLAGQRGVPSSAERMPGGIKLARTPMAASRLSLGGSPLHPSSPTLHPTALPITFQDFLKEVDVRFMDQLRRGASIVATDLARAPQPASLRDCYQLMCLTAPEVDQIEASISTIKEEIDMRKAAVADKEALLANHNPPVFQAVQLCTGNELAEVKRRVGLLKRVCRQRTLGAWKEWRTSMEQHRASWLANHLQLLQQDHAFLQSGLQQVQQVQQQAQELQTRLRDGMQAQRDQHQEEEERQKEVSQMQASLEQMQAANEEHRQKQQDAEARLAALKAEQQTQSGKREQLLASLAVLRDSSQQGSSPGAVARKAAAHQASAQAVLHKVQSKQALLQCLGWRLEGAGNASHASGLVFRYGHLFCLILARSSEKQDSSTEGVLELAPTETGKETQRWHQLAASLADIDSSVSRPGLCFSIAHGRADQVAAAVQDFSCKLGRIEGLVQELDSLRLDCPALSSVTAHNRHVSLVFLGLEAEVKFSVQIDIGAQYPYGQLRFQARIHFQGMTTLTAAEVVEAVGKVPAEYRRLTNICRALGALTKIACTDGKPDKSEKELQVFCNPLFGSV
ncbi:TPA: hypothetical protein ACH3X3_007660 [Trebouxia sp. C0006]